MKLTQIRKLNKKAEATFRRLIEGLTKVGDHKKIDNAAGTFMAVCIEIIDRKPIGFIVSVAHYFEQNGDAMRDPDCTFLVGDDGGIFPLTFRQDNLGVDNTAACFMADGRIAMYPQEQRNLTAFANQWMANVAEQQGL